MKTTHRFRLQFLLVHESPVAVISLKMNFNELITFNLKKYHRIAQTMYVVLFLVSSDSNTGLWLHETATFPNCDLFKKNSNFNSGELLNDKRLLSFTDLSTLVKL